jgi:predicted MFS family arabinose efflux permease
VEHVAARLEHEPEPTMRTGAVIALAAGTQGLVTLPLLLLGTLAASIRHDLHFDDAALGATISIAFAVGAAASVSAGRLAERIGGAGGMRVALGAATVAQLGIAVLARSWWTLLPFAVAVGVGIAVAQPSSDLWVSRRLEPSRMGFAMGTKQALGGPGIGLLAGLAVPLATTLVGWRATFAVGGIAALVLAVAFRQAPGGRTPARRPSRQGDVSLFPLVVLSIAGGLGAMTQSGFTAFAVSAAIDAGRAEGTAGLIFALGTGVGLVTRVSIGAAADRRRGELLTTMATMLVAAMAGFALMATASPVAVTIAIPLLCATCWGWQGIYFLAVARSNPNAPATASGISAAGLLSGGVLGPLVFGVLAEHSYPTAWVVAIGVTAVAAVATVLARRLVRADLAAAT